MPTKLDPAALNALLHAPAGPVMAHAHLVGKAIHDVAAGLIRTSDGEHEDGSVHLKDRGHVDFTPKGVVVVFDGPYAASVHNGSMAHTITATNARALRFAWPKRGPGIYYFQSVNHPGTAGQPFLTHAAAIVTAAPLV